MSQFLGSEFPDQGPADFEALGHTGSNHYVGLEVFPNPGCIEVRLVSDEVMAKCPITGQPDFYTVAIVLIGTEFLIESKSLKLWFQSLMMGSLGEGGSGIFCESLAVHIRDTIQEAVHDEERECVEVVLTQKSRGGIEIMARA